MNHVGEASRSVARCRTSQQGTCAKQCANDCAAILGKFRRGSLTSESSGRYDRLQHNFIDPEAGTWHWRTESYFSLHATSSAAQSFLSYCIIQPSLSFTTSNTSAQDFVPDHIGRSSFLFLYT